MIPDRVTPVKDCLLTKLPAQTSTAAMQNPVISTVIVNADDWGRNAETTNRIFECIAIGTVSSTSAMVFMEDSERAAALAREREVDCGLHLNFTTQFSAAGRPSRLVEQQERITRYLRGSRLAQAVYHPGLASSFRYVVATQIEEYERIFGCAPRRIDGHHHMHLCANVLFGNLLPADTIARRNFSFRAGEKSGINRQYRKVIDRILAKRHQLTDYFFSLPPLEPPSRIDEILSIARLSIVELETHPVNPAEYEFLIGGEILRRTGDLQIARGYSHPAWTKQSIRLKVVEGNRQR